MNKLDELMQKHDTVDLSEFEAGDRVKVTYKEFTHGETVFTGVKDEEETLTFEIDKVTHPSGTSVETILFDPTTPNSHPSAVSVDNQRKVSFGPNIEGFALEIEKV